MAQIFETDDLVYAKVKGYPPWPAQILEPDETVPQFKYKVKFFGTNDISFCKPKDLYKYEDYRLRYGSFQKRKAFNEGVIEAEKIFLSRSQNCKQMIRVPRLILHRTDSKEKKELVIDEEEYIILDDDEKNENEIVANLISQEDEDSVITEEQTELQSKAVDRQESISKEQNGRKETKASTAKNDYAAKTPNKKISSNNDPSKKSVERKGNKEETRRPSSSKEQMTTDETPMEKEQVKKNDRGSGVKKVSRKSAPAVISTAGHNAQFKVDAAYKITPVKSTTNSFHVGDKVFAKVKSYPPWPAEIRDIEILKSGLTKYNVYFYGSKETASCKSKDLFKYMEFKNKYGKPSKRKFFNEGIAELERSLGIITSDVSDGEPAPKKMALQKTPSNHTPEVELPSTEEINSAAKKFNSKAVPPFFIDVSSDEEDGCGKENSKSKKDKDNTVKKASPSKGSETTRRSFQKNQFPVFCVNLKVSGSDTKKKSPPDTKKRPADTKKQSPPSSSKKPRVNKNTTKSKEANEQAFRKNKFANLDAEVKEALVCTACHRSMRIQVRNGKHIHVHPLLKVLLCEDCFETYGDGNFGLDEDGSDIYCRWCSEGGSLFCCSICTYAFCKKCIKRNLDISVLAEVEKDDWRCFMCNPEPLTKLRNVCIKAQEFIALPKGQNGKTTESELPELFKNGHTIDYIDSEPSTSGVTEASTSAGMKSSSSTVRRNSVEDKKKEVKQKQHKKVEQKEEGILKQKEELKKSEENVGTMAENKKDDDNISIVVLSSDEEGDGDSDIQCIEVVNIQLSKRILNSQVKEQCFVHLIRLTESEIRYWKK